MVISNHTVALTASHLYSRVLFVSIHLVRAYLLRSDSPVRSVAMLDSATQHSTYRRNLSVTTL